MFLRLFAIGAMMITMQDAYGEMAKGTFEVKLLPVAMEEQEAGSLLGRMSIDKTFRGELEGTSKGEMLAARTAVKDSAGYVAIEKVTATLAGRPGTFVLQHSATMAGGKHELSVSVVPDSGTGGLTGLTGKMNIIIENKQHFYEFTYSLPPAK